MAVERLPRRNRKLRGPACGTDTPHKCDEARTAVEKASRSETTSTAAPDPLYHPRLTSTADPGAFCTPNLMSDSSKPCLT